VPKTAPFLGKGMKRDGYKGYKDMMFEKILLLQKNFFNTVFQLFIKGE